MTEQIRSGRRSAHNLYDSDGVQIGAMFTKEWGARIVEGYNAGIRAPKVDVWRPTAGQEALKSAFGDDVRVRIEKVDGGRVSWVSLEDSSHGDSDLSFFRAL